MAGIFSIVDVAYEAAMDTDNDGDWRLFDTLLTHLETQKGQELPRTVEDKAKKNIYSINASPDDPYPAS